LNLETRSNTGPTPVDNAVDGLGMSRYKPAIHRAQAVHKPVDELCDLALHRLGPAFGPGNHHDRET